MSVPVLFRNSFNMNFNQGDFFTFIPRMATEINSKKIELEKHYKKLLEVQMNSIAMDVPPTRTLYMSPFYFVLTINV